MELFKFQYATDPTVLDNGAFINKAKSVTWIERYADPGEFEIQAPLSSGLREFLPLGTLISHVDTMEVMIVENHEIENKLDEDPTLKITGRSFESYLEHRIVGTNAARTSSTVVEYQLAADYAANQAVKMINDHIGPPATANDQLVNVVAQSSVGNVGTSELRVMNRGSVHDRLMEILKVDDLGVRTIRRNTFGVVGSATQTIMQVYKGVDRSAKIRFSWKGGELESMQYLFTNKIFKTSALVLGRYVYTMVDLPGYTKYNRRIAIVPADDLDGNLSAPPTGTALTTLLSKMTTRGNQALKSQLNITISQADVSKTSPDRYRRDYNMGDLVSLDGNFGNAQVMRVIEYAEIEDENGESGHPTLSIPGA